MDIITLDTCAVFYTKLDVYKKSIFGKSSDEIEDKSLSCVKY